jgi:hypothetical protein
VLMLCQIANSHALLPCVNRQNSARGNESRCVFL